MRRSRGAPEGQDEQRSHRCTAGSSMADQSHIPEACAILTSLRHCQQQAVEYRRCVDEKGGDRDCGWQHQAFVSCAEDSLEKVVKELTVVASEKCKEEDARFTERLEARSAVEKLAYNLLEMGREYEIEQLET